MGQDATFRNTAKSDFIKVYHLFFETLSGLGGTESEVLNFLVCAMRNSDNTYTGPMKKIAENLSCSKATVQRAMDTLTDKGFVAMEFDCVWRINLSMVIKGNRNKEKVLMDDFLMIQAEYNEKRKARKNGKRRKETTGKAEAEAQVIRKWLEEGKYSSSNNVSDIQIH